MTIRRWRLAFLVTILGVPGASAQGQTQAAPPPPDSVPQRATRAGWYSDRRPIRVGDLITVYIDERSSASERISTVARKDRSQEAAFDATFAPEALRGLGTGIGQRSQQTGTADRRGDFVAALTVRVAEVDGVGNLRLTGSKQVTLDGRTQQITLSGVIRPDDIVGGNAVLSTRLADAVITYEGKQIGPKTSIFGKLLGALWP